MSRQQSLYRKRNMTVSAFRAWLLSQCEEQPAPYPDLEEPCHIWTRYRLRNGYGQIGYHGGTVLAHRLMFHLIHGRWPTDLLCHKCDRRACLTPSHLFEGSHQENMADMMQKQRSAAGEKSAKATIDTATVLAIRQEQAEGMSDRAIARKFGMSPTNVFNIVTGRIWSHVGGPTRSPEQQVKVTAAQVRDIRHLSAQGTRQAEIVRMFNISRSQVGRIVRRESWKHI